METELELSSLYTNRSVVSTLPIRNGNSPQRLQPYSIDNHTGKYLTYKEWKHKIQIIKHSETLIRVSTLPIRNGNVTCK